MDPFTSAGDMFSDGFSCDSTTTGLLDLCSQPNTNMFQQEPVLPVRNNMFEDDFFSLPSQNLTEQSSHFNSVVNEPAANTSSLEKTQNSDAANHSPPPCEDAEGITDEKLHPEIDVPDLEPMTTINNVVCSFATRCHLNLRRVALEGVNVIYKRENNVGQNICCLLRGEFVDTEMEECTARNPLFYRLLT